MNRRLFIERLAALIGLGTVPASALADAAQTIELQRSPVAGFQYHAGESLWPLLTVGAALDLVREIDNSHDPRAVRVEWQGQKLGYVPRIDNAAVSHLLDSGQVVSAEIVALEESSNPWARVKFAVYLQPYRDQA